MYRNPLLLVLSREVLLNGGFNSICKILNTRRKKRQKIKKCFYTISINAAKDNKFIIKVDVFLTSDQKVVAHTLSPSFRKIGVNGKVILENYIFNFR